MKIPCRIEARAHGSARLAFLLPLLFPLFLLGLLIPVSPILAEPPAILWTQPAEGQALDAPEGHAWLRWAPEPDVPVDAFQVERSSPGLGVPALRQIPDTGTFIAGLPEGKTVVRVRAVVDDTPGPWSEPLEIAVSYPAEGMVRGLVGLGSALLLATLALILVGHARTGEGTDG